MERLSSQQLSLLCPPHVQVINVALERFFASFDEASLCRYTLKVQDWMKQVSHSEIKFRKYMDH
jgi:hypothetical protein